MTLIHWPTSQELGRRYDEWLKLALVYSIVGKTCAHLSWFMELEGMVFRMCTAADAVVDMVEFVYLFYNGLSYFDFEVYLIVRRCLQIQF